MRSKESRGAARGAAGESRLRGLLRPIDPVPPSARLRSTPSPPGPPPSFGAPHAVRTEIPAPEDARQAAEDRLYQEESHDLPEEVTDRWEEHADEPETSARDLRTRDRTTPRPGAPAWVTRNGHADEPETSARDLRTQDRTTLRPEAPAWGTWDGHADEPETSARDLGMPGRAAPASEALGRAAWEGPDEPGISARDLPAPDRTVLGLEAHGRASVRRTLRGWAALSRALPRFDPGMPGLRVLVGAGLLAAVVTGVLAWRSRPVAEPIAPPLPAAAVRDLRPITGAADDPGATPGTVSRATPASSANAGPGATPYVPGSGGTLAATPGSSATVVVYVTGKVRKPGVFVLAAGSRVADAIEAAGGLRKGAKPGGVNLARRLVDGEQIVAGSPATAGAGAAGGSISGAAPGMPEGGAVNLNTATVEQLDALPGVGGVIAQRIIEYRDAHGGFQSVDQLKDVPGIGDRKFADIRDKVSV
nr:hypothetical protein GCM10017588_26390 [Microbispora rosea subsp. aerata]